MSQSTELECKVNCWALEEIKKPHSIMCEGTRPLVPMLFSSRKAALEECPEGWRPYRIHVVVSNA